MRTWFIAAVILALLSSVGAQNDTEKISGTDCQGCLIQGKCLPIGLRHQIQYCWLDGRLHPQKEGEVICENDFECRTSLCIQGKCQEKQASWSIFTEIKEFIYHVFRIRVVKRI